MRSASAAGANAAPKMMRIQQVGAEVDEERRGDGDGQDELHRPADLREELLARARGRPREHRHQHPADERRDEQREARDGGRRAVPADLAAAAENSSSVTSSLPYAVVAKLFR